MPLITVDAALLLHFLIFFLAVCLVLYSAVTMMLGKLKVTSSYSPARVYYYFGEVVGHMLTVKILMQLLHLRSRPNLESSALS